MNRDSISFHTTVVETGLEYIDASVHFFCIHKLTISNQAEYELWQ